MGTNLSIHIFAFAESFKKNGRFLARFIPVWEAYLKWECKEWALKVYNLILKPTLGGQASLSVEDYTCNSPMRAFLAIVARQQKIVVCRSFLIFLPNF